MPEQQRDQFWIIGFTPDLDLIMIGENTGPYSQVPDTGTGYGTQGRYATLSKWRFSNYSGTYRAPIIDKMKRREPDPDAPFDSREEAIDYLIAQERILN